MATPEPTPRPGLAAIDRGLALGNMEAVKRALFELDDEQRRILEAQIGGEALARSYRSARSRRRGPGLGRVVVLPGLMGTQLDSVDAGGDSDRIWVKFLRIIAGRMGDLKLGLDGSPLPPPHTIKTSGLYKDYLPLLLALDEHWQVRPFGYDWRVDVDLSAAALADDVRDWAEGEPAHLLVHSMGGLVARRFIQLFPAVWASMADPDRRGRGGRLVMLGTPNRGSFAIPGAMSGNEDVVKKLALLDVTRGVSGLLPILNTFLGSYQTMPSPKVDLGDDHVKLFDARSWGALPVFQSLLDAGKRFQETLHPVIDPERLLYVAGYDQDTPSRIRIAAPGRFEYQQTKDGDGRVPHELGLLKDVRTFYVSAKHGDLSKDERVLGGIHDLLLNGETSRLESLLPRGRRAAAAAGPWAPFPVVPIPPELKALATELRAPRRSARVTVEAEAQAARVEALVVSEVLGSPSSPAPTAKARSAAKTSAPPSLRVEVVWGDITKVQGDVYAVGHYHGVSPQNAVEALDRAISGSGHRVLADHVKRGLVSGELGRVSFFPWGRRTVALAGMGFPGTFGEGQLRALARSLTWAVANVPGARTTCCVLIGSGDGNLSVADSVVGMFRGMAEALAEGPVKTGVTTLRLVERRRDRAFEIQDALLEVKKRLGGEISLVVAPRIRKAPSGIIGRDEAASLVVGAAVRAVARGTSAARRRSLTALLGDDPRAAVAGKDLTEALERLAQDAPSLPVVEVGRGPDLRIPTRISFAGDSLPYRVAAITNTTTVAERPISIDPSLVTDLVERMTDPEPQAAATLSDLLRRLLVPGEFENLLEGSGAYVFEVDRTMARLHWEMLAAGDGALPLSVTNPLARQLRTIYSAPPSANTRSDQKRTALVIGDPGDPAKGQSLPGARREAIRVVEILTAHGVEVTARIGAPGDSDTPSGFEPADRLDCLYLLMKGGFDILHYAGHGDFDPERPDRVGWVFKSGLLTARELQRLSAPPRLVVANACLSARTSFLRKDEASLLPSLADEFFCRGVRDYVGTAWEVNDQGAVLFMEQLYAGLLATPASTIGQSVQGARKALYDQRNLYGSLWAAYQHYGDPLARVEEEAPALPSGQTKTPSRRGKKSQPKRRKSRR
jgi:pimeloyl-ACP methyl ester carboxylesterase